uniref:Putative secreted protein n=1 Tax=Anopheles darlingi TaxID=43151 RepID=A0A2M4DLU5_ANODA
MLLGAGCGFGGIWGPLACADFVVVFAAVWQFGDFVVVADDDEEPAVSDRRLDWRSMFLWLGFVLFGVGV